jgi:hypothetical protein
MNFYRMKFYKPRNGEYQKIGFASIQLENIISIEPSGNERWMVAMSDHVSYLIDDEDLSQLEAAIQRAGGTLN